MNNELKPTTPVVNSNPVLHDEKFWLITTVGPNGRTMSGISKHHPAELLASCGRSAVSANGKPAPWNNFELVFAMPISKQHYDLMDAAGY